MRLMVLGGVVLVSGLAARFLLEDPMPGMGLAAVGALVLLLGFFQMRRADGPAKPTTKPAAVKAAAPAPDVAPAPGPAKGSGLAKLRRKLNSPVGKGGKHKGAAKQALAAEDAGGKRKRRKKKADEDDGPLFPKEIAEAEPVELELHSSPARGLGPVEELRALEATDPGPPAVAAPGFAPAQPAEPSVAAAQIPLGPGGPGVAAAAAAPLPDPVVDPDPQTEDQTEADPTPRLKASAEPEAAVAAEAEAPAPSQEVIEGLREAMNRPKRVCGYCWEPNDPANESCTTCGEALKIA